MEFVWAIVTTNTESYNDRMLRRDLEPKDIYNSPYDGVTPLPRGSLSDRGQPAFYLHLPTEMLSD
jgi:hypothetical protein